MADDLDLFGVFDEGQKLSSKEVAAISNSKKENVTPPTLLSATPSTKRKLEESSIDTPATTVSSSKDNDVLKKKSKPVVVVKHPSSIEVTDRALPGVVVVVSKPAPPTAAPPRQQENPHVATGTQTKNVISYSAVPVDYVEDSSMKGFSKPAKTYPFQLDPFQQLSVDYIEKGESVLVSAHTSAGKTAVAEYAIAKSLRDKQRVIYTSPIKALSNQKYRDLEQEFGDVGLMTGDITINPNATCLIMTTEILRSMLYRGSEVVREVAWVIYDEIHYMRDKERGVVWEESIILLPHKVRFVFLSATIPNSKEFAEWICKIHHQPCHVVYTDYRPTPLQHYLFPANGDGLHLVVDEKGKFREENFQKALAALSNDDEEGSTKLKKKKKVSTSSDVLRIVKMIMEREYDPVIIFSFSKRDCESFAMQLSKLDFNTQDEKTMVEQVFHNAIDSLSEDDKKLPQVHSILPLLKRGIGIHHGGLLPILKEIIEIMFGEGLLKCLFATETFSMGLNMPAKTVVFTQCRKFDGKESRWITSGEYIQMSGRAGRRSLDSRGIVIQMLSEKMEPQVAKDILYGQADPLFSTFHLGYNMLLNLLRVEDADPEYMIKQSFHQFQNEKSAPGLEEEILRLQDEQKTIVIPDEQLIGEYYHLSKQITKMEQQASNFINLPQNCVPFLNPGRLVYISDGVDDWGWGTVVDVHTKDKLATTKALASSTSSSLSLNKLVDDDVQQQYSYSRGGGGGGDHYIVQVLLKCKKSKDLNKRPWSSSEHPSSSEEGELLICPLTTQLIKKLSVIRIYMPKDLTSKQGKEAVNKSLLEVQRRFPDGLPLLDPITDMNIVDSGFQQDLKKIAELQTQFQNHSMHTFAKRDHLFQLYNNKMENEAKIRHLRKEINATKSLVLKDDLRHRKRVLRRLGYVDEHNVIQTKGRTSCEVSTANELVVTELIFSGLFNKMAVNDIVALLSCIINTDKPRDESEGVKIREQLEAPFRQLQDTARMIATVSKEAKIEMDVEAFVDSFQPTMMEMILAWCEGAKFSQIIKLGDVFEGTIIRIIRRLEEFLRQLTQAAHSIGNSELEQKFSEGRNKIKRDIVFAASLYL